MFGGPGSVPYGSFLRRYYGVTDPEGVSVPPELLQSFVLEQDRPEWRYLMGVTLCRGEFDVTSIVGEVPFVALFCPANILAVVTEIRYSLLTFADIIDYRSMVGSPAFLLRSSRSVDFRVPLQAAVNVTACRMLGQSGVLPGPAGLNSFDHLVCPVNGTIYDRGGIVLGPNTSLVLQSQTAGINRAVGSVSWYERRIRDGES